MNDRHPSIDSHNVYRRCVLQEAWHIAALVDRDPLSRTRGSCSRMHWAWKFNDFPFPRMQEAIYALCRLHDMPGSDNPLYRAEPVADWIRWGFEYWAGLQHPNGSYDEAYPNEQCLAATAFTSFYLGEAFLLRRDRLASELQERLLNTFRRAGDWLCANGEGHAFISNHLGVAVCALEIIARITQDERYLQRARFFLDRILDHQSPEGWLLEYDGADIGYGTHGFFYLAVYWRATGCERTRQALSRFAEFLGHFIHPDGSIGGEYGSRNTEFYYPAGFEILAPVCPFSRAIAVHQRSAIAERRVCGVWNVDVFNLMPMFNNLLFAADAAGEVETPVQPLPWQQPSFEKHFAHSGLWVVNQSRMYAIVGLSKGGTISVFDKRARRLTARHAGLACRAGKRTYVSQDHCAEPTVAWSQDRKTATIDVAWKSLKIPTFTPLLFLMFRMFTLTVGRLPAVSTWVKGLLVAVLIRRKHRPNIQHRRTLRIERDRVIVTDHLTLPNGVEQMTVVEQFIAIHMGSSMYCDARAVESGTRTTDFPAQPTLELHGVLGLDGASWSDQEDRPCAESAA